MKVLSYDNGLRLLIDCEGNSADFNDSQQTLLLRIGVGRIYGADFVVSGFDGVKARTNDNAENKFSVLKNSFGECPTNVDIDKINDYIAKWGIQPFKMYEDNVTAEMLVSEYRRATI